MREFFFVTAISLFIAAIAAAVLYTAPVPMKFGQYGANSTFVGLP